MKKFFSIVAAAVIALSFASCNPNEGGVQSKSLKIVVSDVTFSTANVAITPVDEDAYYYFAYGEAENLKGKNVDSLLTQFNTIFASLLSQGATVKQINQAVYQSLGYYVFYQGEIKAPITKLTPNTEYAAYGFVVEIANQKLVAKDGWSVVYFKTPEKKEGDVEPLAYDANKDFIKDFDEYELDGSYVAQYGIAYAYAEQGNAYIELEVNVDKNSRGPEVGTYPIDATGNINTVTASSGLNDKYQLTPSYACTIGSNGYTEDNWFLVSGTVTYKADGSIVVDAKNSYGKAVKCTLKAQAKESDAPAKAPAKKFNNLNTIKSLKDFAF
jgi:hypothetical protein